MKKATLFVFLFIFFFFSSILKNDLKAQTATTTITYTGFQACGGCTVCGADYWCFNTLSSYCGNTTPCGTQTFMDPVPAGNIVTNIAISYYSGQCSGGSLTATINGNAFPTVNEGSTGCPCSGLPCGTSATTGSTFPCGVPAYNYGALNNFQMCTGAEVCINAAVLTLTYAPANQASPATQPGAISGTTPVCAGTSYTYSIPAVANASSYTWTVPAGWIINSGQGTTTITATPGGVGNICVTASNLCGTSASTCYAVTLSTPSTAPTSATPSPNPICAGASSTLTVGGGSLGVGANWNWYSGSCGGTLVGSGSSIVVSPGSTTNYYVLAQGTCNTTTCASTTVTVIPIVTPTFTAVSPICSGDALAALPTTSNDGITGNWSPAINNTTTTTYTFTPNAGQCANSTTMTITVNPNVTPTFTAVAPICSGDALAALPTTSNNGITGNWTPALNNTTTTTYTFTPSVGQCATTTTMTITVTPGVTPTFTAVPPICSGDALAALPTTSTNSITGTWSPAINNTATTTYTFTPTAGQCATTTTMTITVNAPTVPTFTAVSPICSGDALAALPTTSTNSVAGTWSPAINNTATTTYTFTPTAGQCATTTTMTITVNPIVTPTFTAVSPICSGAALAALPTTSNNSITGNWTPALNNTTTTIYTFTPSVGQCAVSTTMTITVNPNDDPNFSYTSSTYCLTGADPTATITGTLGGTFTITAPGVINASNGTIDLSASGLGSYTVTYNTTSAGNPCPTSTTFSITITSAPSAAFSYDAPTYCQNAAAPILTYGAGASGGVFTANPANLSINAGTGAINLTSSTSGIYTIYNTIVASGGCAAALDSTTIEIYPMYTTSQSTAICQGDSILLGGANQISAGIYYDTLFSSLSCDSIIATTLTINPIVTTAQPLSICQGDSVFCGGTWITTGGICNDTLSSINGCDSVVVTTVTVTPLNTITPDPITPVCASDPIILSATGSGSGTITWYTDAAGTAVIGTGSPLTITNPGIGTYTYYVNEVGSCSSNIDSVVVVVGGVNAVINATPLTGAIPLDVFFGNGSTTGPGISYSWNFGDGNTSNQFEPSNVYNNIGDYTVILIVTDGICSDTTSITIDAFGESVILIPNVFTPNGDGSNDVFTVEGENLESVEGEIFNRWGQKMFSWNNVKGYWDGRTLSGSEAPDGTYFYIITAIGFDGKEYFKKGGVSLIK